MNDTFSSFHAGLVSTTFFSERECSLLRKNLEIANWIPALVAGYIGNEFVEVKHDPILSTALVTKEFVFDTNTLDLPGLHARLQTLIKKRFKINCEKFSNYGVSKYLKGSKLLPHADTGIYNTNRLITCILYLESAIQGGDIRFPEIDVQIAIKTGMLICFYSELQHEVKEIIEGQRIAMILFAEA